MCWGCRLYKQVVDKLGPAPVGLVRADPSRSQRSNSRGKFSVVPHTPLKPQPTLMRVAYAGPCNTKAGWHAASNIRRNPPAGMSHARLRWWCRRSHMCVVVGYALLQDIHVMARPSSCRWIAVCLSHRDTPGLELRTGLLPTW